MNNRSRVVAVELRDGTQLNIEATILGGEENVSGKTLFSFIDISGTLESVANIIVPVIEKVKPQKASVEFGLEISVKSGKLTAVLVQGTGTANLKIALAWEKDKN